MLAISLVSISVTGCYTTNNQAQIDREAAERPPPPSADELRTHSFSYGKDAVYDAILSGIFESGGTVETSDRQSGLISTGWNSGGSILIIALTGNYRIRHSFLVRDVGTDSTSVIYTLNMEMASGVQWQSLRPNRSHYRHMPAYWESLAQRLSQ
jgi:hypothetical protein